MLGEARAGQKKYAEAEPLLLQGYHGMKQREKSIPPQGKAPLIEGLERLVQLYDAWGRKDNQRPRLPPFRGVEEFVVMGSKAPVRWAKGPAAAPAKRLAGQPR
jgi:hypothetical protein